MSASAVQFASVADHVLETEERLTDLIDHLLEIGSRLDSLENTLVEAAGEDPLTTILARLDAFDNRLAKLELRQRRPPPFPITVVEGEDSRTRRQLNDLTTELATERYERARRDQDLHNQQQGWNGAMAAFNDRLNQCAAQFCRIRERLVAVEARTADTGE
jgi:primosomal protein N''